ncbi:hypothetical protein EVAR_87301_1 [Eumeta japonica]|uniref:Uncharacterized protein n=1 Tax=Eumeta variegata TaxID=151549 RepID=A0A4C1VVV8_EUMVA|nr:hypothetical protein EVAR_87301_1 [Eumeta japonica]
MTGDKLRQRGGLKEDVVTGVQRGMLRRFGHLERISGSRVTKQICRANASATPDGLAPEGASQTKKVCLQVIKKRPRKPDVADVHEWCSAATV